MTIRDVDKFSRQVAVFFNDGSAQGREEICFGSWKSIMNPPGVGVR